MRTAVTVLSWPLLVLWALAGPCWAADAKPGYADPPMPAYRVDADGCDASAPDVKAVCDSVGRELWRFFPGCDIEPFVVTRGRSGPIVIFERNPRGEIVMRLDTGNTYWCQYAYQFSHEFCHILCGFDEDYQGNKWFEEKPERWEAVRWLNSSPSPQGETFQEYLQQWHDAVPGKHQPFVERIADLYGIEIARKEQAPDC